MKIDDIIKSMESKLDETNKGLIADDLGNLIQTSYDYDNNIKTRDEEINKLKGEKEKLLTVNGNLLQKVGVGYEEDLNPKKEDKKESIEDFNFASLFDKKGNWK